jgi:ribosome-associated heat shock protein Hsp15
LIEHDDNTRATGTRLDVWLWAARFFRTRSLARQAIDGRKVSINQAAGKPARPVHVGDRLRITRGDERIEVDVLALDTRRGPASVAQTLYRETEAGALARAALREQRRFGAGAPVRPPSRPDKHARQALTRLKNRGAEPESS